MLKKIKIIAIIIIVILGFVSRPKLNFKKTHSFATTVFAKEYSIKQTPLNIQVSNFNLEQVFEPTKTIFGKVSYYSHDGCLGCSVNQITASGEAFNENAMTLAIPFEWRTEIPMGARAVVTNLDNGMAIEARVNDMGGFLRYDRIADLSKGLMFALDAKTDTTNIKIDFYF